MFIRGKIPKVAYFNYPRLFLIMKFEDGNCWSGYVADGEIAYLLLLTEALFLNPNFICYEIGRELYSEFVMNKVICGRNSKR